MELMTLIAQTGVLAILAAWLLVGVRDNIMHPDMNRIFVAQVLALQRIRDEFPDDHAHIAGRAITNPRTQRALFGFVVVFEGLACLLLWIGIGWMALAILGMADPATAKAVALAGSLAFTTVWAGFLVVGNHFAYWYCHEGAQNTHFHLTLMGIGAMILLVAG